MNWLQKTCKKKSILEELESRGWTSEQTSMDGLQVWRHGNEFLCSLGDWSHMSCDDIVSSVKYLYPKAKVECDAECGAPEHWEKVI